MIPVGIPKLWFSLHRPKSWLLVGVNLHMCEFTPKSGLNLLKKKTLQHPEAGHIKAKKNEAFNKPHDCFFWALQMLYCHNEVFSHKRVLRKTAKLWDHMLPPWQLACVLLSPIQRRRSLCSVRASLLCCQRRSCCSEVDPEAVGLEPQANEGSTWHPV